MFWPESKVHLRWKPSPAAVAIVVDTAYDLFCDLTGSVLDYQHTPTGQEELHGKEVSTL